MVLEKHLAKDVQQASHSDVDYNAELAKLVDEFVESLPVYAENLQTAAENSDWEKVASLTHQLKGTGGAFGFQKITALAMDVENNLELKATDKVVSGLSELFVLK